MPGFSHFFQGFSTVSNDSMCAAVDDEVLSIQLFTFEGQNMRQRTDPIKKGSKYEKYK